MTSPTPKFNLTHFKHFGSNKGQHLGSKVSSPQSMPCITVVRGITQNESSDKENLETKMLAKKKQIEIPQCYKNDQNDYSYCSISRYKFVTSSRNRAKFPLCVAVNEILAITPLLPCCKHIFVPEILRVNQSTPSSKYKPHLLCHVPIQVNQKTPPGTIWGVPGAIIRVCGTRWELSGAIIGRHIPYERFLESYLGLLVPMRGPRKHIWVAGYTLFIPRAMFAASRYHMKGS